MAVDEEEAAVSTDQHGQPFRDFGFVAKAEEHKKEGNAAFGKAAYADALVEYDAALLLLTTVAEDRAVVVGQKKWDEVVALRSLLHLNRSACHCKVGAWREAVAEAHACLVGNIPAETENTHPHILANAPPSSIPEVDRRVTKGMRAKAWFRMSEGYMHMGYYARANHAAAKCLKVCEDEALTKKVELHIKKIAALAKRSQGQQQKRFQGYWEKLQRQQGGYVKGDFSTAARTKSQIEGLPAEEKLRHLVSLDDGDDDEADFEGFQEEKKSASNMLGWDGSPELSAGANLEGLQSVRQQREAEERARARQWEALHAPPKAAAQKQKPQKPLED